jgi:hypothetical protein
MKPIKRTSASHRHGQRACPWSLPAFLKAKQLLKSIHEKATRD